MPTVAQEGEFRFVVRTRDHPPAHVHVLCADGQEVRINLNDGSFLDEPPPSKKRAILKAFYKHVKGIRDAWDEYHERRA
ncbi:MAG: DUF4160 domain-containing protein [Candidatus Bipolaricaulota bacterium]|nr:DUF4160 domain-containing protein [Candidatus Bipolaricaulota bacterium]MDW8140927.1 DUF4160 domain-containing protein [Candidatus Bipolaricaulota bacterium]